MQRRTKIDLEDMSTWPNDFCDELLENKELILSYHQEKIRLDCLAEDIPSVRFKRHHNTRESNYNTLVIKLEEMVYGSSIVAYHCTRLTDYETEDIKKNGLKMLTPNLVKHRIECAKENNLLSDDQCSYLLQSEHIQNKLSEDANRLNMVFLTSSRNALKEEHGVGRFFKFWGGEAIYVEHENDPNISHKLRTIGNPCIVKCSIPFSEIKNSYYDLSKYMILYFVELSGLTLVNEHYAFDPIVKRNVQPKEIIDVVDINHDDFVKLTEYNKWRDNKFL